MRLLLQSPVPLEAAVDCFNLYSGYMKMMTLLRESLEV